MDQPTDRVDGWRDVQAGPISASPVAARRRLGGITDKLVSAPAIKPQNTDTPRVHLETAGLRAGRF